VTRKSEPKLLKAYEVCVTRTITRATEGTTIRVQAANKIEAESIAESLYLEGDITFEYFELQECDVTYTADELTDKARIARLMLTIRQISAATTASDTEEIIATIQGYCKEAIKLEKQGNTP
jgi:hypothetical protein